MMHQYAEGTALHLYDVFSGQAVEEVVVRSQKGEILTVWSKTHAIEWHFFYENGVWRLAHRNSEGKLCLHPRAPSFRAEPYAIAC